MRTIRRLTISAAGAIGLIVVAATAADATRFGNHCHPQSPPTKE